MARDFTTHPAKRCSHCGTELPFDNVNEYTNRLDQAAPVAVPDLTH
jgi:hypothetical protein